jgi:tetratricopeptide (TPR) repeat protein
MRLIVALLALLIAAPAQAQDWWVAETDHFIVKSRDSEANTRRFASQLERFDGAMRTLQNLPVDDKLPSKVVKLTVYRFGDQGEIGAQLGNPGVAGFFLSQAGNSVAFVPARESRDASSMFRGRSNPNGLDQGSVLQHEYTHYFMRQHFPAAYPRWYSEGYAEVMATLRFKDDGSFHIGDPPQYRAYQVLEIRQFPLEEMLDSQHEIDGYDYMQFYGTGWLLSHYLNFDPARFAKLNEYLRALGQGEDSLAAAQRIFGDLDKMQDELLDYRDGPFPGYDVKPANYREPQVTTRPMTAAEQAMLREEMRLNRGVTNKEAKDVAADARRKIRGHENDYGALLVLARAEARAENYAEAERLALKLIEMDPTRSDAWLVRSDAAFEQIEEDKSQAGKAREYATKAAALDRADPRPLINYYYSYVEAGEEPPEAAIIALETAFEAAASDPGYRIILSRQLASENRLKEARTVLLPIAFSGHSYEIDEEDKDDPTLEKVLDRMEAGDHQGTVSMFDALIAHWEKLEEEEDD